MPWTNHLNNIVLDSFLTEREICLYQNQMNFSHENHILVLLTSPILHKSTILEHLKARILRIVDLYAGIGNLVFHLSLAHYQAFLIKTTIASAFMLRFQLTC